MRDSADLAAGSESVVREFLKSSGAVGRGAVRPSNHPFSRARRLQPERFLKSAQAALGGTRGMRNSADLAAGSESVVREFLKISGGAGRGASASGTTRSAVSGGYNPSDSKEEAMRNASCFSGKSLR